MDTLSSCTRVPQTREDVIRSQLAVFERVRQILGFARLQQALDALQLRKSHSLISVDGVLEKIRPALEQFESEMAELESQHVKPGGIDALRERLGTLLESRIGLGFTADEMTGIAREGEERYERRIPPGYDDDKDKAKQPPFTYGGVVFQAKFGDLILWKEILRFAKTEKVKQLMLVSDDEKADWRHAAEYRGERLLLPRAELVDEIRREAGTDVFYIYSSELFLKYAKERLHITISESTIPQVSDIKESTRRAQAREALCLIEVIGGVGNRRDAELTCGACWAEKIPLHFYEGDGVPKLLDVLGVFHYWECPAIADDATVSVLLWGIGREAESLIWRKSR